MKNMSEKVAKQIESMKAQTFGVEVEMCNITRENAAKIVGAFLNGYVSYKGGCYRTWVVTAPDGRKWQFERDSSIMARTDDEKCEMVTPILHYEDMETLQKIVRLLRKNGAKSSPKYGCGVHIHVGKDGHTAQSLTCLTNSMKAHEGLLIKSVGIDTGRLGTYCKVVDDRFLTKVNQMKPTTMEALADIWYRSQGCEWGRDEHYNHSRYHMLNLHATFTKGTIEFRLFQFDDEHGDKKGGLHAGQLKSYIQLCLAMSARAKASKKCKYTLNPVQNDKYVMRVWLKEMGMVGDEFKTARDCFAERLTGYSCFRECDRQAA